MRYIDNNNYFQSTVSPGLWPALEWAPEFWRTLFNKLQNPVLVLDEGGKIIVSNLEATRLLDLHGLVGSEVPVYLKPMLDKGLEAAKTEAVSINTREGKYAFTVESVDFKEFGKLLIASGHREPQYWPGRLQDDSGLDQSVAMASEVSQKVKGPLAGIELYASILEEEVSDSGDNSLKSLVNEIRDSLKDVNEYLTSIESMSKDINLDLENINLIDVIDQALASMSDIFKAKHVRVWFDQKPIQVLGDRRLLVQLYMNIFLNSVEAMVSGGRLMIRMSQDPDLESEVVITDTGPGIDYGVTREVFNPFYTTKGKALGLGLPVSRRIVEAHDGLITVGSDLMAGARISVRMPGLPARLEIKGDQSKANDLSLN
jgi:nitrogen-specific signal transduction histidine kinase